ncbi:MAG: hypothetical protein HC912_06885 [Saprospiraceae bacterium]|nr:hypothetical protein [Saprospiraceae bacterium]
MDENKLEFPLFVGNSPFRLTFTVASSLAGQPTLGEHEKMNRQKNEYVANLMLFFTRF